MNENLTSGINALDDVLQGLRPGDNVVWQVDDLKDYLYFARPFAERAIADGKVCIYIRFAPHTPVLEPMEGLTVVEVDPGAGFDIFSAELHGIIEHYGVGAYYVLDNLSALVDEWATDELLANFFQVTCPYLFELDTVTYFALTRGKHAHSAVARIRDTTQILIDVYHVNGNTYIHPLKVWDRFSPQMFLPHLVSGDVWSPVFQSGTAAAVVSTARKHPLRTPAGSIAPWESVFRRLNSFREAGVDISKSTPELDALRLEFCRMLMGNQPEFNKLADKYFTLEDLFNTRDRLIGSGRVGGKAAGMLLARRILLSEDKEDEVDFSAVLEDHDSFYIGSDVFFTFLVNNDLFRLRLQVAKNPQLSREEYEGVEQRFLLGEFPRSSVEQFKAMLDYFGQAPIIVRSSSLLEDSFGNAFAGKYLSEFLVNQGDPEARLDAFMKAVKRVYASALNPDALAYRRHRGLGDRDEQMAILVQRVSGMPYGKAFFPSMAGVGFSQNLYAWSDRIDPKQGVVRLVFGLGTRAVERVGNDYPRMISVSSPQLRPETGLEVAKYSQREMDVLNMETNELETVEVSNMLSERDYPNLYLFVSTLKEDYIQDPVSIRIEGSSKNLVLTFNNLIRRTDFVKLIGELLSKLDRAYGHPVDIEFTATADSDGHAKINLLQCRPLFLPGTTGQVIVPEDISHEQTLFRSSRMVNGGVMSDIRYVVYVDPRKYAALPVDVKKTVGRIVGKINEHPLVVEGKSLMMGPGRWGSSNIELGVNVGYADIDNTCVLVEVAREEAGHVPEVSYGTHFFQDLVENHIVYLPVYPDDPASEFNSTFFDMSPNVLSELLPEIQEYETLVHIIDVPAVKNGAHVHVIADPRARNAICFVA